MDTHRKWKESVYDAISDIGNLEFQKKAWLGNSAEFSSSFIETISALFDDTFFVKFLSKNTWNELGLDEKIHEEMNKLRAMIESYKEPSTHLAILNDSNWHSIVDQAQKVTKMLDGVKSDF